MATYERAVRKRLKNAGWRKHRQGRTSHQIWRNPNRPELDIVVPSKIKSRHTANSVLKQAGLAKLP
ncbi:MAG: type II toxin-antitoxin system HicA family toxin [Gammaproteobacteria bacterium]|nr:type II toxin-antitoxin system HicA family toxin [Gammaproteobacteria bacterium]MYL01657.1 type II toxin-antitoxin system HicA family toxin [Gammaproteobacteria bacterium]